MTYLKWKILGLIKKRAEILEAGKAARDCKNMLLRVYLSNKKA
jgi:hypothetical protein